MYANFHFGRKVVLLVCIKSTLIMSFHARTINKTPLNTDLITLEFLENSFDDDQLLWFSQII